MSSTSATTNAGPDPASCITPKAIHALWTYALNLPASARLHALSTLIHRINSRGSDVSNSPIPIHLVPLYLDIGLTYAFLGEYLLASHAFDDVVKADHENALALFAFGLAQAELECWQEALRSWTRCRRRFFRGGTWLKNITHSLFQRQEMSTGEGLPGSVHGLNERWALELTMVQWNINVAACKVEATKDRHNVERPARERLVLQGIPAGILFGPSWTFESVSFHNEDSRPAKSLEGRPNRDALNSQQNKSKGQPQQPPPTKLTCSKQQTPDQEQESTRLSVVRIIRKDIAEFLGDESSPQQPAAPKAPHVRSLSETGQLDTRVPKVAATGKKAQQQRVKEIWQQQKVRPKASRLRSASLGEQTDAKITFSDEPREILRDGATKELRTQSSWIKKSRSRTFPPLDRSISSPFVSSPLHKSQTPNEKESNKQLDQDEADHKVVSNLRDNGFLAASGTKEERVESEDAGSAPRKTPPGRKSSWSLFHKSREKKPRKGSMSEQAMDNLELIGLLPRKSRRDSSSSQEVGSLESTGSSPPAFRSITYDHGRNRSHDRSPRKSLSTEHAAFDREHSPSPSPLKSRLVQSEKPLPPLPPDTLRRLGTNSPRPISVEIPPVAEKIMFYNSNANNGLTSSDSPSSPPPVPPRNPARLSAPRKTSVTFRSEAVTAEKRTSMSSKRRANTDSSVTLSDFRWMASNANVDEEVIEEEDQDEFEEELFDSDRDEATNAKGKSAGLLSFQYTLGDSGFCGHYRSWSNDLQKSLKDIGNNHNEGDELSPVDAGIGPDYSGQVESPHQFSSLTGNHADVEDFSRDLRDDSVQAGDEGDEGRGGEILLPKTFAGSLPPRQSCNDWTKILGRWPARKFLDASPRKQQRPDDACFCQRASQENSGEPSNQDGLAQIVITAASPQQEKEKEEEVRDNDYLYPRTPLTALPRYTTRESKVYCTLADVPTLLPPSYSQYDDAQGSTHDDDNEELPKFQDDDNTVLPHFQDDDPDSFSNEESNNLHSPKHSPTQSNIQGEDMYYARPTALPPRLFVESYDPITGSPNVNTNNKSLWSNHQLMLLDNTPPMQQDNTPPMQQDNTPPMQQDNTPPMLQVALQNSDPLITETDSLQGPERMRETHSTSSSPNVFGIYDPDFYSANDETLYSDIEDLLHGQQVDDDEEEGRKDEKQDNDDEAEDEKEKQAAQSKKIEGPQPQQHDNSNG